MKKGKDGGDNSPTGFAHLHTHSGFSFRDGPSTVEALVLRAAELGQPALALTDTNSVTGLPSLSRRCAKAGIKPIGGAEVVLEGGYRLTLLAGGPVGFASLCHILSAAGMRDAERKGMRVRWEDIETHAEGLVCLSGSPDHGEAPALLRRGQYQEALQVARRCLDVFGPGGYHVEVTRSLVEGERSLSDRLFALADHLRVPAVATNAVAYAAKTEIAPHEALRRVRLGLGPQDEHAELPLNAERYVKSAHAMRALFPDRPDAVDNARLLAERLDPPLDPAVRHLPAFPKLPPGETAFSFLAALTWAGAEKRYKGARFSSEVQERLIHELEVIRDLGYCDYYLVCKDVCDEARRRGVGFALRGSAVGSAVAHCLGMSPHDPIARRVSFERFLSKARRKPPDIDIDFRHDERDAIMDYTRATYGADRVANVANYVTYRGRSLLRDLGKVLGHDTGEIDRLRELLWHSRGDDLAEQLERLPELRALGVTADRYADLFALCGHLAGLPRHLGTHSSGLVVSDTPLAGVAPLVWAAKGVPVVAFDKDDVEAPGIGLLKMDQLSLRALTAVDIASTRLAARDPAFDYDARDRDDPETLTMIRAAETIAVFQIESPAQMALQWRLQAEKFDDLVASVALIRPGPLLGKSVEPYIWRRRGWQPVTYPLPALEPALRETYGRILFQDQVLDVVRIVGGYEPDEADAWLKTMTHARDRNEMLRLGLDLRERVKTVHGGALAGKAFGRLWKQIEGFSQYGFCHGHALAFAAHAQGTAWLLRHHPAEFLAAVLSVEPCGFWPICTVVSDAERRGVRVLAPCVNRSLAREWLVESVEDIEAPSEADQAGIRCSFAAVRSVGLEAADAIVHERDAHGLFTSLADACDRLWFVSREAMEWLVLAGCLDALCLSRREALWSLPVLHRGNGGVGDARSRKRRAAAEAVAGQASLELPTAPPLPPGGLPDFPFRDRYWRQWEALGFSPEGHPMRFKRKRFATEGVLPCVALQDASPGARVTVAGLCLRPHRPPTPSGETFVFLTLEDETGLAQVTVAPDAYEACGAALFTSVILAVEGVAEKRGAGVTLRAGRAWSI